MDYFQHQLKQWADWQAVQTSTQTFEPLIRQIYASENEPFKALEPIKSVFTAVFQAGQLTIAIFPPATVAADTRDRYQTERFSLTRLKRLGVTAPILKHAGFIFDKYQFYYVIYQPLLGVPLTNFKATAKPLAKTTLGEQIGQALLQLNSPVASFNAIDQATLSNQADWTQFGPDFASERTAYLAAHPVATDQFVHGQLTGENIIVTTGHVGVQQLQTARQAPRAVELVPLVLAAFDGDTAFIHGLQTALGIPDLVATLMLGILWRADGPKWVSTLVPTLPVTLATLKAALAAKLDRK